MSLTGGIGARHEAHPWIESARGCAAITRGPLVYCFEEHDQPKGARVLDSALVPGSPLRTAWKPALLGGLVTVQAQGRLLDRPGWQHKLYRAWGSGPAPRSRGVELTAIPYYAWANRARAPMTVWIPAAVEPGGGKALSRAAANKEPAKKAAARAGTAVRSKGVRKAGSKRPVRKNTRKTARRKG
jgi:hypothetical protein